jgi:hypothetical protein
MLRKAWRCSPDVRLDAVGQMGDFPRAASTQG